MSRTIVQKDFTGTGSSTNHVLAGAFSVSVYGTFDGTVALKRSPDGGTTWIEAATPRSAPDVIVCDEPAREGGLYKLECTAFTSGTISTEIEQ